MTQNTDQSQNILAFAQIVNRLVQGYRVATNQEPPADWAALADEDKKHIMDRVMFYLTEADVTVSSLHDAWAFSLFNEGWSFGEKHDVENKTHPMLVAYSDLPLIRRVEDTLFMQTIQTLSRLM